MRRISKVGIQAAADMNSASEREAGDESQKKLLVSSSCIQKLNFSLRQCSDFSIRTKKHKLHSSPMKGEFTSISLQRRSDL